MDQNSKCKNILVQYPDMQTVQSKIVYMLTGLPAFAEWVCHWRKGTFDKFKVCSSGKIDMELGEVQALSSTAQSVLVVLEEVSDLNGAAFMAGWFRTTFQPMVADHLLIQFEKPYSVLLNSVTAQGELLKLVGNSEWNKESINDKLT